jgi:haloacetate dehalogenase
VVDVPIQVLWGEQGLAASTDLLDVWRRYAPEVTGQAVPDCGHFLAEEQPQQLADLLLGYLNTP